jgi:RNA polymerase sigma-54 factor
MRLEVSQQLRMSQEMRLSPRIIQAMEILQLPLLALQERIEAELLSNPVLEIHESENEAGQTTEADGETAEPDRGEQTMVVRDEAGQEEDFQRLDRFVEEYGADSVSGGAMRASSGDGERDRKLDAMANAPAPAESLNDYLLGQWAFVEAPPAVKAAGEVVIGQIAEDGYLRTTLEEIASASVAPPAALPAEASSSPSDTSAVAAAPPAQPGATTPPAAADAIPTPAAEPPSPQVDEGEDEPPGASRAAISLGDLEAALKLVQGLDPIGVGARDLKECLLLQLAAEELAGADVSLEKELVQQHLGDIEMNRLPQVAKRTGKTVEQVKRAIENLARLNPRPGLLVGVGTAPTIRPDVFVDLDDAGEVVITIPEGDTPHLYVSGTYRKLVRDRSADRQTRQYLTRNIRAAQWLIDAIQQRRRTVRRVVEEVFAVQRGFLDDGPEALHPLPMGDVARKVGVHVATVSRAVSGKYVQTPRGIYPLRMFFSGGTSQDGGQDVAWDAIKVKLRELVAAEDKRNPLSDDELAAQIEKQGITIARRTVAKYRSILKIPPYRRRKQF